MENENISNPGLAMYNQYVGGTSELPVSREVFNARGTHYNTANPVGQTPNQYKDFLDFQKQTGGTMADFNTFKAANKPQDTFLGMNKNDIAGVGAIGGLAGTGFDIYDKMWGKGAQVADSQIANNRAQAQYNIDAAKHKKDFSAGLAKSGLTA